MELNRLLHKLSKDDPTVRISIGHYAAIYAKEEDKERSAQNLKATEIVCLPQAHKLRGKTSSSAAPHSTILPKKKYSTHSISSYAYTL
ncbi:hypothetical protein Tco_0779895 [Tanacetum coccineum]